MHRLTLSHLPAGHVCTYAHHALGKGNDVSPHDHDFHEFFWVEENEGTHWINGASVPLQRGDLVLVRAPDCHSVRGTADDKPLRIVNFAFQANIWRFLQTRYFGSKAVFFANPSLAARTYRMDDYRLAAIRQAAARLRSGLRDRLQAETFLLSVLALLSADQLGGAKQMPAWIRQSCSELTANRNFAGGMPALVGLTRKSPEHIAREFRRYLDRTPIEVINDARMSHAADRLATSDDEILKIAFDCGLENLGHFYRLFRERYGCTPRVYRLRQQAVVSPPEQGRGRRMAKRARSGKLRQQISK